MELDTAAIDDAVLALLYLTLHDQNRAWKGHDWDALGRLHERGFIDNPAGKTKSVVLTETGLRESGRLFRQRFVLAASGKASQAGKAASMGNKGVNVST